MYNYSDEETHSILRAPSIRELVPPPPFMFPFISSVPPSSFPTVTLEARVSTFPLPLVSISKRSLIAFKEPGEIKAIYLKEGEFE